MLDQLYSDGLCMHGHTHRQRVFYRNDHEPRWLPTVLMSNSLVDRVAGLRFFVSVIPRQTRTGSFVFDTQPKRNNTENVDCCIFYCRKAQYSSCQ